MSSSCDCQVVAVAGALRRKVFPRCRLKRALNGIWLGVLLCCLTPGGKQLS